MLDDSFIITPDKFLSLASNWISRYDRNITFNSKDNIFFIKPDFIDEFFKDILPKINFPFKLITHDSDIPTPPDTKYNEILNNPFLIKWFGMNCHLIHPKLQPIPIGMANECWPHGNKNTMIKVIEQNNEKNNLIYCNFDPNTNIIDRYDAIKKLQNKTFIDFEFKKLDFESYLTKLSTYKYIISPPGNSIDCHRIWEAIYLKTIPVVLKSLPMVYFKDAPILFINDWDDITQDLLYEKYHVIKSKSTIKSDYIFYKNLILNTEKYNNE